MRQYIHTTVPLPLLNVNDSFVKIVTFNFIPFKQRRLTLDPHIKRPVDILYLIQLQMQRVLMSNNFQNGNLNEKGKHNFKVSPSWGYRNWDWSIKGIVWSLFQSCFQRQERSFYPSMDWNQLSYIKDGMFRLCAFFQCWPCRIWHKKG